MDPDKVDYEYAVTCRLVTLVELNLMAFRVTSVDCFLASFAEPDAEEP